MNYADIKEYDVANGQGIRMSLFVSGCPHHCKNCFNEDTWDFNYGNPFTEEVIKTFIEKYKEHKEIYDGITILGGEPFAPENVSEVLKFVDDIKQVFPYINIWIYSGYTIEELINSENKLSKVGYEALFLLSKINVLVDGRFVESKKDLRLKFRGSSNQRIINMEDTMRNYLSFWIEKLKNMTDKIYIARYINVKRLDEARLFPIVNIPEEIIVLRDDLMVNRKEIGGDYK